MVVTEKLYYQDPYIQSFSNKILKSEQDERGRFYVVLEKTAFYPTGGGQPHDTGTINHVRVYDVEEVEEEIRHYVDSPLIVKECFGEINWERRFDHMQQHAGQHILSAAFEEVFGYKTISFHLGYDTCTIDLEVPTLAEEEAQRAEERANSIVLENRPIETRWVTEDEVQQYPLRKALSVTGDIRLVIIPEFDYNGCGGTHPKATGQVSSIKILHWEKQKKNIRLHFVCGNRVLKQLHEKHRVIQSLNATLNAPQDDLEAAAKRVLEQQKNLEKTIDEYKKELLQFENDKLLLQAIKNNHYSLIKKIYSGRSMAELQQLARSITVDTERMIVFLVNENNNKLQLVCGRSKDININMREFIKDILSEINGKGGGTETLAQGGGERLLSTDALVEKMEEALDTYFIA
jgi:alanyl-tRNA synthetase